LAHGVAPLVQGDHWYLKNQIRALHCTKLPLLFVLTQTVIFKLDHDDRTSYVGRGFPYTSNNARLNEAAHESEFDASPATLPNTPEMGCKYKCNKVKL